MFGALGRGQVTGEPLIQRADDNVTALKKRLAQYHSETEPVIEYYRKKGAFSAIDAAQPMNVVWQTLSDILSKAVHA